MKIAILSLQGDFEAHGRALTRLGIEPVYVRHKAELNDAAGLIIPGGESTTMLKLLEEEDLFESLLEFAAERPILGTCAGSILMAREVISPPQRSLDLLDISIERNAYGRQVDSSIRRVRPSDEFVRRTGPGDFEAVFIRAPIVRQVGSQVNVLALEGSHPVLLEQDRHIAATFHPELTEDGRVHRLLIDKIRHIQERVA